MLVTQGACAEKTAKENNITRQDSDTYALESYRRTAEAYKVRYLDQSYYSSLLHYV